MLIVVEKDTIGHQIQLRINNIKEIGSFDVSGVTDMSNCF